MTFDPFSSYGRWVITEALEEDVDRTTAARAAEERLSLAYRPELPPPPVYGPVAPGYEDDPELWLEAERHFGHWPHDVADVDAALAAARKSLGR